MSSTAIRRLLGGFLAALLCGTARMPPADPIVLHISPAGADGDPGTPDRPIRSLGRLRARLAEKPPVTEVIFHGGISRGGLMLGSLSSMEIQCPPAVMSWM